jgi:hypothetical protein
MFICHFIEENINTQKANALIFCPGRPSLIPTPFLSLSSSQANPHAPQEGLSGIRIYAE